MPVWPATWENHQLPQNAEPSQARAIARAWARASIDRPLHWLLLAAFLVTVLSMAAATTGYILAPSWIFTHLHTLATLGILALIFAAAGLIYLGRQAFSNADVHRKAGILWDIAAFWPRAAHPLAPPGYMERTLPALVQRIETIAENGADPSALSKPVGVVLSSSPAPAAAGSGGSRLRHAPPAGAAAPAAGP